MTDPLRNELFKCDLCVKEYAISYCENCLIKLGEVCHKKHKRLPATKSHKLIDIGKIKISLLNVTCRACDDSATAFCEECPSLLCEECSRDHKKIPVLRNHALSDVPAPFKDENRINVSDEVSDETEDRLLGIGNDECNIAGNVNDVHFTTGNQNSLMRHKTAVTVDIETTQEEQDTDNIPSKPSANWISTDSIELIWRKPELMTDTDTYQVRYREVPKGKWKFYPEEFCINKCKISGLTTDTTYVFKVRLVNEDGESKYSEESEEIRTLVSLASTLLKSARKVKAESSLDIYQLPLTENRSARNEEHMTKKYDIGPKPRMATRERTIILLGATRTGKSTFVDVLTNHLLGVKFEDPFRFTLMDDQDREKQENQAVSKTDWITCYSFNPQKGTKLDYRLNVIDTPGFGDTRGSERDKKVVKQIRYLFSEKGEEGVRFIDAVCLLVRAPDARLTNVFQTVMSMFGKDIAQNFCTLITFADGSDPPVLAAMKKSDLPFGRHFTFNNSALFANNQRVTTNLAPMFWEMGIKSLFAFFEYLQNATTRSLQLTTEVLTERYRLELTIQNLQLQIDAGLSTILRLKDRKAVFKANQDMINDNKDFEYEETKLIQEKIDIPPGKHVTNCLCCNMTCHENCDIANDDDKAGCWAMDPNGNCRQCVGSCHWTVHKNTKYIIKCREVRVKKTYKEMAEKYKNAAGKVPTLKQLLEKMQEELDELSDTIEMLMTEIRECNNRLKEIALRPNPLDVVEEIELMIEVEEMEKRSGFQGRIEVLREFRKRATIAESFLQFQKEKSVVR